MFQYLLAAAAAFGLAGSAHAESDIRFAIDGPLSGASAAYVYAADSGIFAAAGLNVDVRPTRSGLDVVGRVALGNYLGGVVDFGTYAEFLTSSPGAPLIAVMVIQDRPAYAIIGHRARGVSVPADLIGHTLGFDSSSLIENRLVNFSYANDLRLADIERHHVDTQALAAALAHGEVDAILGTSYEMLPELAQLGVPPEDLAVLHMADLGVVLYGQVVVINTDLAKASPGVVKKLLSGILNGWKATIADPAAAVATVIARDPALDVAMETERLHTIIAENVLTPYVLENGIGDISQRRIEWNIAQLQDNPIFIASEDRETFFSSQYLPPPEARAMK